MLLPHVGVSSARADRTIGITEVPYKADPERGSRTRHLGRLFLLGFALGAGVGLLLWCAPAFADTTTSVAPGLSIFTSLESWIQQYGLAGAPLAICFGGLMMAVEHHQQRTGNAIRAKGYIFAACAGLIVIALSGTIVSAITAIAGS